mgnify:CR=1 FL=1
MIIVRVSSRMYRLLQPLLELLQFIIYCIIYCKSILKQNGRRISKVGFEL